MENQNDEMTEEQRAIKAKLEAQNKAVVEKHNQQVQEEINKNEYRALLEELGIPVYGA